MGSVVWRVESEWTKLTKVKILVSGLCQEAGKAQNCLQTIRHYLQTVKNIVSFIGLYQAFSGKCLVKSGDTGEIIVTSSSRSHHKLISYSSSDALQNLANFPDKTAKKQKDPTLYPHRYQNTPLFAGPALNNHRAPPPYQTLVRLFRIVFVVS